MEVIKCNTEVVMETIGEARNLKAKRSMAESWFASSNEINDDQLKLKAKKKKTNSEINTNQVDCLRKLRK